MLSAEAEIGTPQPERYVSQFAKHARQAHRLHRGPGGHGGDGGDGPSRPEVREVSVTGAACTVSFSTGRCTLAAAGQALRLRAEAASEQDLAVIQGLVTRDIERFGHREGLRVRWHPA